MPVPNDWTGDPDSTLVIVNTTSGGGNTTSEALVGLLMGVYLNFHADEAAGTVTTIQILTPKGETITILTLTSVNTDGYYVPCAEMKGPTGTGLGVYTPYVLTGGTVKVTVASDGSTDPRPAALRAELIVM